MHDVVSLNNENQALDVWFKRANGEEKNSLLRS